MYCPYCGDQLERDQGTWKCLRGGMVLSLHAAKMLYETFITKTLPGKQPDVCPGHFSGGHWFCPACGTAMSGKENTNGMLCPQCNANLQPFIWELIELNYHNLRHGGKTEEL